MKAKKGANSWIMGRFGHGSAGFLIKLLVSLGAVTWVMWEMDWNAFLARLTQVNWFILIFSAGVFATMLLPVAFRWRAVMTTAGIPISASQSLRYYLIGVFFNNFFPTGRGGDLMRTVLAARDHHYAYAAVFSTVMVERLAGLLVALGFVLVAGKMIGDEVEKIGLLLPSLVFGALLLACSLLIFDPKVGAIFLKLTHQFHLNRLFKFLVPFFSVLESCRKHPSVFLSVTLFSILNQTLLIIAGLLVGLSIEGFGSPWYSYFLIIPLTFFVALLPSVGGYGVREAGFVVFFGWFDVSPESAFAYGLLHLLGYWALSLTGAFLFILRRSGAVL